MRRSVEEVPDEWSLCMQEKHLKGEPMDKAKLTALHKRYRAIFTSLARDFPMRSCLHAVTLCFALVLLGGCSAKKDEAAVLIPVQAMFDGMAHRDAAAIKAPWLP